jgi:hypothetical protein
MASPVHWFVLFWICHRFSPVLCKV